MVDNFVLGSYWIGTQRARGNKMTADLILNIILPSPIPDTEIKQLAYDFHTSMGAHNLRIQESALSECITEKPRMMNERQILSVHTGWAHWEPDDIQPSYFYTIIPALLWIKYRFPEAEIHYWNEYGIGDINSITLENLNDIISDWANKKHKEETIK